MLQGPVDRRSLLTGFGAVCCLSALLLAPLAASQGFSTQEADRILSDLRRLPIIPPTFPQSPPPVVTRDPFAEPPDVVARFQRIRSLREADMVIRVEGIIDGRRPRALVRVGDEERIVAVGDSVDGIRIIGIDDDGLRLTSGVRLRLEAGSAP